MGCCTRSVVDSVTGSELIPISDTYNGAAARAVSINTVKEFIAPEQLPIQYSTAYPVTTDIDSGYSKLWKNTATGELRLYANDNGVMKFVLLS